MCPRHGAGALARSPGTPYKSHLRGLDHETRVQPRLPCACTQKEEITPKAHPELSWPLMSLESSWRKEAKQL